MQYGPAPLFPRACELPGGPPSDDAMLVTCAYLVDESSPWVLQSLFLAAIGEARDRGATAIEAFAYRYPEGETPYERFHVHKTVFPADFLGDFGFRIVRSAGRVGLARLELGGSAAGRSRRPPREGAAGRQGARSLPEPLPAPRRPCSATVRARRRLRAAGCPRSAAQNELRDLDRVQRGALAEVVAREEQGEAVLDGRIAADPADEHLVDSGRLPG